MPGPVFNTDWRVDNTFKYAARSRTTSTGGTVRISLPWGGHSWSGPWSSPRQQIICHLGHLFLTLCPQQTLLIGRTAVSPHHVSRQPRSVSWCNIWEKIDLPLGVPVVQRPHYTEEEVRAQRGRGTCPRPHSQAQLKHRCPALLEELNSPEWGGTKGDYLTSEPRFWRILLRAPKHFFYPEGFFSCLDINVIYVLGEGTIQKKLQTYAHCI